ncbi:unnamed protein product [Malus baccata var. baccata]
MTIPNSNRIKKSKKTSIPLLVHCRTFQSEFPNILPVQYLSAHSGSIVSLRASQPTIGGVEYDGAAAAGGEKMIEVVLNDRLGKKVRVKCNEDDTIGDLKKLVAAQTGTRPDKIRIQKWYNIYKDHITLKDYEIHDGMGLELYYN